MKKFLTSILASQSGETPTVPTNPCEQRLQAQPRTKLAETILKRQQAQREAPAPRSFRDKMKSDPFERLAG
ncbi:MAG: hypothetical protein AAGF78_14830 [Pseudomonadota bacterium]